MIRSLINIQKTSDKVAEIEILDAVVNHDEYKMEKFFFNEDNPSVVSAISFREKLKELGNVDAIKVLINSIGGDVANGVAIYSQLREHPAHVIVDIIGQALSTAGWVAQAGDEVNISQGGMVMIHEPSSLTYGDVEEHNRAIRMLNTARSSVIDIFKDRTQQTPETIENWMKAETWFSAQEALDAKIVDKILDSQAITNSAINLVAKERFRNYPVNSNPLQTPPVRRNINLALHDCDDLDLYRRQLESWE